MLFLLRNIRRKMLGNNKIATYLLYAIGEIILVVVGILIAVSIDDWNKDKQNNHRIELALGFLTEELVEDSITINKLLSSHIRTRDKSKALFDRAASKEATIDTLVQIMSNEFYAYWDKHFAFNKAAYDNMLNGGVLELMEDSLKLRITDVYHTYERNQISMDAQNEQYRIPMSDFYTRFPILPFYPHEEFESQLNPTMEKEFHPRAEWLLFLHYYMWNIYINHLEEEKEKVNQLLFILKEDKS